MEWIERDRLESELKAIINFGGSITRAKRIQEILQEDDDIKV
jgi:hypothetical protein